MTSCIVCNEKSDCLKKLRDCDVDRCSSCGLEFCNPMPSTAVLNEFYVSYVNPRANPRIVAKNAQKNITRLLKLGISKKSRLLDFGCGDNTFVTSSNSPRWMGYDKYTFPEFPEGKFDCITLWGVLEHLTDPVSTIYDLSERLNSGGILVMTTVGTQTPIPYQYKSPEHVTWWSDRAVEILLEKVGITLMGTEPYKMYQDPQVYFDCVLNAGKVPKELKKYVKFERKRDVYVPTNEIFISGSK